jgi:hypothetical protein
VPQAFTQSKRATAAGLEAIGTAAAAGAGAMVGAGV